MGITILSTLVDLIIPSSEIRKYARLVIGIVLIIILISPIARINGFDVLSKEFQLSEQIAAIDQANQLQDVQWKQIEQEFSNRLKDMVIEKIGSEYSHIELEATLSSSGIKGIVIKNANEEERETIRKILKNEFKIPQDNIDFIGG